MQSSSSVYGNFNDHIFVDSSFYHYEIFLSLLIHSISWLHRWFQILILYCMWGLEIWLLPLCRCGGLSHHGFSKWQSLQGSNGFKYGSLLCVPSLLMAARHFTYLFWHWRFCIYTTIYLSIFLFYILVYTTGRAAYIYVWYIQKEKKNAHKKGCFNMCLFCLIHFEVYLIFSLKMWLIGIFIQFLEL